MEPRSGAVVDRHRFGSIRKSSNIARIGTIAAEGLLRIAVINAIVANA